MSLFFIFMVLIIGAIAFMHYTQGFFSATISAILAAFSAVLALSYHETIVESILGGAMADSAHAMVLLVLFAAIYLALRTAFDQLVPHGLAMPAAANKVGGVFMGLRAGTLAAGVCAFAAQTMSLDPRIMGYSRVLADESSASIPEALDKPKNKQHPLYDFLQTDQPLHSVEDDNRTRMYLPVDDILVDMVKMVSDKGALSSGKPLASVHPDWLMELFGQRLGIEAGGKRVAMNLPGGKQTDVIAIGGKDSTHPDAGPYLIDRPLEQKLGEQKEVSKLRLPQDPKDPTVFGKFKTEKKGELAIVIRVYFGPKAMDAKNNMIEVSCGAVRLCTQHLDPNTGELEWTNYNPIGTLEDGLVVYRNRADDYIFVDPETSIADFVFMVEANGFVEGNPPANATPEQLRKTLKITEGTFLEVKRLARQDLSGQQFADFSTLASSKNKSGVVRKDWVKPPTGWVNPNAPPPPAKPDPAQVPVLSKKLIGSWEGTMTNEKGDFIVSLTFTPDGKMVSTSKLSSTENVTSLPGTWKAVSALSDGTLNISVGATTLSTAPTDQIAIHIDTDEQITAVNKGGQGTPITLSRTQGGTPPGQNPTNPPAGNNNNPPPPIAVKNDPSLQLLALPEENAKFYQAISVPAASGEATVDGGKVTMIDGKIAVLMLNDADPAKLRGAGEQANRFMQPDGTVLMQAEAAPGPGGWAWKDRVEQIKGFDAAGKEYPLIGVWAIVNGKITARFNPDGVSLADYKPAAPPTQIWLLFKGADNAPITKVMIGQAGIGVKQ